MAARRLSMRKVREVLRLRLANGMSIRQIACSCNIGRGTVQEYLLRARLAGLSWPLPESLDDGSLEQMLYPPADPVRAQAVGMPPMEEIHRELKRKGVTLQLLWQEYKGRCPDGYGYSRFCQLYRQWEGKLHVSLRQSHRAGERLFVDWAGQTIPVVDPHTAEVRQAYLFVAVLGASNYTFAKAYLSQHLPLWIEAHVEAFRFLGGVPEILVPDNTKTGVTHPCYYEPDINRTYHEMAAPYGCVVIPTRVRAPRDKAKVEAGVLVAERWIVAALRNRSFFSLGDLNCAIEEKLDLLNNRKMQKVRSSRRELFECLDRPVLKALPAVPYQYAEWKTARVHVDYHVEVQGHYYSVPYQLIGQRVDVRITSLTIEILLRGKRVVSHVRSSKRGGYTTLAEHRPKSHQRYLQWSPSRIIRWAAKNGPCTEQLVTKILQSRAHPEQGFRSCLGIVRLATKHSPERLEAACLRALALRAYSYKSVASILRNGLDKEPLSEDQASTPSPIHSNIRGQHYYR
jgi:transposase